MNTTVPSGTPVLNTTDGEVGTILNGFALDQTGWAEYDVSTPYGIEEWKRSDFLLMSELDIDGPTDEDGGRL